MMILLYGVLAVVWVFTMILACWFMIDWDPNTAAMQWWKKWPTELVMWALFIWSLPLLIVMLVFNGVIYVSRRL